MGSTHRHAGQRPSPHRRALSTANIHNINHPLRRSLESALPVWLPNWHHRYANPRYYELWLVYGQPVTRNAVIGLVAIAILVALIVLLTLTHASPE